MYLYDTGVSTRCCLATRAGAQQSVVCLYDAPFNAEDLPGADAIQSYVKKHNIVVEL